VALSGGRDRAPGLFQRLHTRDAKGRSRAMPTCFRKTSRARRSARSCLSACGVISQHFAAQRPQGRQTRVLALEVMFNTGPSPPPFASGKIEFDRQQHSHGPGRRHVDAGRINPAPAGRPPHQPVRRRAYISSADRLFLMAGKIEFCTSEPLVAAKDRVRAQSAAVA